MKSAYPMSKFERGWGEITYAGLAIHSAQGCALRTVYTVQCTLYTVQCRLYSVDSTVYTVQCRLYTSQRCTLYTVHRTLYIVHCTRPNDVHADCDSYSRPSIIATHIKYLKLTS